MSGADKLWGMGRLKMRKWNHDGMDEPWQWDDEWVCVDHHETVTLPINDGNPLPSEVDAIKASIYWYDHRHEEGASDMILLSLKGVDDSWWVGSWSNDNKQRLFFDYAPGVRLQLEIYGYIVTSDDVEECGTDSMKVYYSWFTEDGARDDPHGPTADEIEPEGPRW